MTTFHRKIGSPLGPLHLVGSEVHLTAVVFDARWSAEARAGSLVEADAPPLAAAERQIAEYFGGHRRSFDLPLLLSGSDFQRRVWSALNEIPYGETWTYARLSIHLGAPSAVRAVGRTNGLNPLCIILPCHRVIGADGSLTGYAGGLAAKRSLLQLEGALPADLPLLCPGQTGV